jgi:hypothetical protein
MTKSKREERENKLLERDANKQLKEERAQYTGAFGGRSGSSQQIYNSKPTEFHSKREW